MKKIIENYEKPTPPGWRRLGDFALVMIPTLVMAAPNFPIAQDSKDWIVQIGAIVLVAVKFWTGTKVNSDVYEGKV